MLLAPALFEAKRRQSSRNEVDQEIEAGMKARALEEASRKDLENTEKTQKDDLAVSSSKETAVVSDARPEVEPRRHSNPEDKTDENDDDFVKPPPPRTITFDTATNMPPKNDDTLYIPGPRDRDRGQPLIELNKKRSITQDGKPSSIQTTPATDGFRQ